MACVVEGCTARISRKENEYESLTFYRFPSDVDLKDKWIQCINRPNWRPKSHSRICSRHFNEDSFVVNANVNLRQLKANAVPTVFEDTDYFIEEPLPEIDTETISINPMHFHGTFIDEYEIEEFSRKKIKLLEKQVQFLRNVSKHRLIKINTLTKQITQLTKRNAELYAMLDNMA